MGKRFKLRLSRVFQICRSKQPQTHPQNPSKPEVHWLFPAKPKTVDASFTSLPAPPPSTPEDSFTAPHVASARCRTCAGAQSPSEYSWREDGRWHVVSRRTQSQSGSQPMPRRKICGDSTYEDGDVETMLRVLVRQGDRRMKQKKKSLVTGRTTSSAIVRSITSGDSACFSSEGGSEDDGDETDALLSTSRSFSNDTLPEYYRSTRYPPDNQATKENQRSPQDEGDDTDEDRIRRLRRFTSRGRGEVAEATGNKSRGMVMEESVAVVKRSENPLEDFKRSMAEMIVEKRMFGAGDLEQLLQCFLSLNARPYHGVIVEAFAEIWQALFFDSCADNDRRPSVSSSASGAVERC